MAANPFAARTDGDWSIAMPNDLAGLKEGLNGLGAWLERHQIDTETENRARLVFEEYNRLFDGHVQDIGDGFSFEADLQCFAVVALALACLTRNIDIRE